MLFRHYWILTHAKDEMFTWQTLMRAYALK
jgi:hypothetical protein